MDDEKLSDRADWGFGRLLRWHLKRGTRPQGQGKSKWIQKEFADKAGWGSASMVGFWIKEKYLPETVDPFEIPLLGKETSSDSHAEFRQEFRQKFAVAKSKPKQEKKSNEISPEMTQNSHGEAQTDSSSTIEHRQQPRNLPYPSLGRLFKGRNDTLQQIHDTLFAKHENSQSVVACAIFGLGGVGKTRVAIEYAFRYREEYSALFFLRADSPVRLRSDFAALASPENINLPEAEVANDEIKIAAVLRWLDLNPTWLMIFDNVDDATAVHAAQGWLAKLSAGHVLLNGCMANLPASIPKLDELSSLDHAAAHEFLLMRTNEDRARQDDDDEQAAALVTELGALALGLEQAGAYIATERISFSRYLHLWREKRKIVVDWFDRDLMTYDHDTGLAATWATSVDRLTPESLALLEQLSFFAPDPIPETVFDIFAADDEAALQMDSARAGLFSFSLMSRAVIFQGMIARSAVTVHRLVQDFTRRRTGESRSLEAITETVNWIWAAFSGDPTDAGLWWQLEPLVPHMSAIVKLAQERNVKGGIDSVLERLGGYFRAKGRFIEAEQIWRRLIIIRRADDRGKRSQIYAANNLAEVLFVLNHREEAEAVYNEALPILGAPEIPIDLSVTILNNFAELLRQTGRKEQALERSLHALELAKSLDESDLKFVRTVISLASSFSLMDMLMEAEVYNRQAVDLAEQYHGSKYDLARSYYELAKLLFKKGVPYFAESDHLFVKALEVGNDCLGLKHPLMATFMIGYASLALQTGRLNDTEALIKQALSVRVVHFPPTHPSVREAFEMLLAIFLGTGRDGEADQLRQQYAQLLSTRTV